MTEFRKVHIGRDWLDVYFAVDPGALLEEGFRLHPDSWVRISLQSDQSFRSNPISRFGGFRSPAREAVSALT